MCSKAECIALKARDTICLPPGGDGYGDPLDHDLAAMQADLDAGLVSPTQAEAGCGVVVAEAAALGDRHCYTLDREASAALRVLA